MEHTKGPWKYKANKSSFSVFNKEGKTICKINNQITGQEECARLIAVTPGLLESVKRLLRCLDWIPEKTPITKAAEKEAMMIIAKVEGK